MAVGVVIFLLGVLLFFRTVKGDLTSKIVGAL